MKLVFFSFLLAFTLGTAFGQAPSPMPADLVLKDAYQLAAKENKNVFVMFHASWCGWCHKMDASMNDISCKKFFDDSYIIRHLVIDESKDKKHLENPGAQALLEKYEGTGSGIPYWLVFNSEGELIADSKRRKEGPGSKGENVGCPASEPEVDHWIDVLKKTSKLNKDQLEIIKKRFRKNEQ